LSVDILSRIDYCNVVFAAVPSVTLAPLRGRVVNAAQRELYTGIRFNSASRKLCVIMHSVVTGTAPDYIPNMVTPVYIFEGRAQLRLYDVPRTGTLIGSKAFSVGGPTAWSSLPQSICNMKSD